MEVTNRVASRHHPAKLSAQAPLGAPGMEVFSWGNGTLVSRLTGRAIFSYYGGLEKVEWRCGLVEEVVFGG